MCFPSKLAFAPVSRDSELEDLRHLSESSRMRNCWLQENKQWIKSSSIFILKLRELAKCGTIEITWYIWNGNRLWARKRGRWVKKVKYSEFQHEVLFVGQFMAWYTTHWNSSWRWTKNYSMIAPNSLKQRNWSKLLLSKVTLSRMFFLNL